MEAHRIMRTFFRCFGVAMLIASLRWTFIKETRFESMTFLYYNLGYIIIIGIFTGLTGVFSEQIYLWLKKNLENESCF